MFAFANSSFFPCLEHQDPHSEMDKEYQTPQNSNKLRKKKRRKKGGINEYS